MKPRHPIQSSISLASRQIEEALARGFNKFVNSNNSQFRNQSTSAEQMLSKSEKRNEKADRRAKTKDRANHLDRGKKGSKLHFKGHASIHFPSCHDHGRSR